MTTQNINIQIGQIKARLAKLPEQMRRQVLPVAARAGADVFVRAARQNAPVRTGRLRDSIRAEIQPNALADAVRIAIIATAPHAHLVEYGTAPHLVGRVRQGRRPALAINGQVVTGPIPHPGAPAQPFMRPAVDENQGAALAAMARAAHAELDRLR